MKIAENRYIDAAWKLLLFGATIHMIIIIISAIMEGDITLVNFFNILDLEFFFPNIIHGTLSQILSLGTLILLYVVVFLFYTKKK